VADYQTLEVSETGDVTVVQLRVEEIPETIIQRMTEELGTLADELGSGRMLINLQAVSFLTSSAIGMLIALQKRVRALGGTLKLCNLHPDIHQLFTITQVDRLFDIESSEDDALGSFS